MVITKRVSGVNSAKHPAARSGYRLPTPISQARVLKQSLVVRLHGLPHGSIFDFVGQSRYGFGDGHGTEVAVDTVSQRELPGFGFFGTNDGHVIDQVELSVADLGLDLTAAGIDGDFQVRLLPVVSRPPPHIRVTCR